MPEVRIESVGPGRYRVAGPLTLDTVIALRDYRFDAGSGAGEIDLASVERVDSAALALLLHWQRNATARGQSLTYAHLPGRLRALIDLYDLDGVLPIAASG